MKVVIIAGGKGTRIASVNNEIPKAMIPVDGKPVIERQIEMAVRQGYNEFIIITGYLGEQIQNYFGNGSKWGAYIDYVHEDIPLGTAGSLPEIKHLLEEDFFVFYGDTVMDIDMHNMLSYHQKHHADATLFVHPNDHPYDSDIIVLNEERQVKAFANKPHPDDFICHNIVNAALFIFHQTIIDLIPKGKKSHIEKDILPKALDKKYRLYGYLSFEYVKDMGTPDRYQNVCNDWLSGRVLAMNRMNKSKAVFLDRDGVINVENGLIYKPCQLMLVEGIEGALNYIHNKGYLVVIVSNQSVIARNLCDFHELDTINAYIETFLGKKRTFVNAFYYCPHHPDKGYPEERKEYKIHCNCRKPAPGLLLKAAEDWNIDLRESFMIGDQDSDVMAGINAGVKKAVKIPSNKPGALLKVLRTLL